MKKISAIIKPIMQDDVIFALHKLDGFPGAVIDDVLLNGRGGGGALEPSRPFGLQKAIRLSIVCSDDWVDDIVEAIVRHGHTGLEDDGLVVVCPADGVWSIQNSCSVEGNELKGQ